MLRGEGEGGSGSFFLNIVCMKHYPSYELVAWTDHGRLRMIPSLVEELARPDLERLEEQDRCPEDGTAEIDWLIGRSCEYERLADFFRRVGDWEEEYRALDLAARVCSWCSDSLWLQGTHSDSPPCRCSTVSWPCMAGPFAWPDSIPC